MQSKKVKLCAFGARYTHSNLALHCLDAAVPFDMQIIEANINQDIARVVEQIVQGSPDAVGFSCYIWSIDCVIKAASSVKKILPGCLILLGGPEVSHGSETLMRQYDFIDMIIRGGGEAAFAHFMQRFNGDESIMDTPSACVRDGGEIVTTPDASDFDMNDLPFVYADLSGFDNKIIYYETSRGCPYKCAYCMSADMPTSFLDVRRVRKEFAFFMQNNVPRVKLTDRTFNYPEKRAHEIFEALVELSDKYPQSRTNFHFEISANLLTDESLALLKTVPSGLVQFEIGIQSTNPQTLRAINRNFDMRRLMRNTKALCAMKNIHVHVDLIAGLPFEDYEKFTHSFNSVYALGAAQIQLGFLKVLKGSPMFDMAETYEIAYTDYPPYEVLSTHMMNYSELSTLHRVAEMVETIHNSGRFTYTLSHMCKFDAPPHHGQTDSIAQRTGISEPPADAQRSGENDQNDIQPYKNNAFAFFEAFVQFAQEKGYFEQPQGKHVLFELLLTFAHGDPVIHEALVCDWLQNEKPKRWPRGLKPNLPDKEVLHSFYNSCSEQGCYAGLTAGQISRRSFVCTFLYLFEKETTLLFDYSDPQQVTVRPISI